MAKRIRDKKVEESLTETTKLLQYKYINGQNRLFGGQLMAWIDEVAALTAMRHCGGLVTTCAVDTLRFKYGAYLNEVIVLIGKVTYVGNTSMEVRVDTYVENIETGIRRAINHAYLTCVHVDEDGKAASHKVWSRSKHSFRAGRVGGRDQAECRPKAQD